MVAVQIPVGPNKQPDYRALKSAVSSFARYLKGGQTVIVESTIAPKTSEKIIIPIIEHFSNLKAGEFNYAYCPETVMPGTIIYELRKNRRVIGMLDRKSGEIAKRLYTSFSDGEITLTDIRTSEVIKLMENIFRDVNIASSANSQKVLPQHFCFLPVKCII